MKVIVCGAGRVGFGIASQLSAEKNEVTVIDLSPKLVQQISTDLDVRGVVGHGSHPDVLVRAGIEDADMIVAATHLDEVNMVACQIAHSLFNVSIKIARVRAQAYLDKSWQHLFSNKNMPIDVVISPEIEVARTILQRIATPGAFMTVPFAGGRIKLLGVRLLDDCPVANTALTQLTELFPDLNAMIVGVKREGTLFVPKGSDQVLVGDEVYVVAQEGQVARTLDILGRKEERGRKVIMVGAGNIGIQVAKQLEKLPGIRVRVIENNSQQAEQASIGLNRTVILNGDALDRNTLIEAGVNEADIALALTNDDRVNVLVAGLAKEAGVRRALCLVNDRTLDLLKEPLGIDVFIDPRETTISTILQHVRRGRIIAVQSIEDGEAEVIEAVALATSALVGKPLRDVDISDGIKVAAVQRGEQLLFPNGDFVIKAGDHVVLFAERKDVPGVEKMFRVSRDYV
ncbi:MAG: Trk system potassium transporter TrkA [Robiginitomaculum sp.]|nr:Trk system potassium transporter TrkA [Robiginitomaculum sp.]MDQ7078216.1 Trk system potassium transporter TrkA [Robiginitomaculum sp.]